MCDGEDGEFYEVSAGSMKTARKAHTCSACREPIAAGDSYYKFAGMWDGHWDHIKQCARCREMFREIAANTDEPVVLTLDCGVEWIDAFGAGDSGGDIARASGIDVLRAAIDEYIPPEVQALAFALPGDFLKGPP